MNCLKSGHFLKRCESSHYCRTCQKPHHTLLHIDAQEPNTPSVVYSNTSTGTIPDTLLMTCQVFVRAPGGSKVKVHALLDSASFSSFVSEHLVQNLCTPQFHHRITVSGVAGLTRLPPLQSIATVEVSAIHSSESHLSITAVVVPWVTCYLPLNPVCFKSSWTHLNDIMLADPNFGCPSLIDLLLGVDIYTDTLLHGPQSRLSGSPVAFETIFGCVLAGRMHSNPTSHIATHHVSTTLNDDDGQFIYF